MSEKYLTTVSSLFLPPGNYQRGWTRADRHDDRAFHSKVAIQCKACKTLLLPRAWLKKKAQTYVDHGNDGNPNMPPVDRWTREGRSATTWRREVCLVSSGQSLW
jgi:hypothetical protein